MRWLTILVVFFAAAAFSAPAPASGEQFDGVWTKTTHPDPGNLAVFFVDSRVVRAIGHGRIAGRPALWYAEGLFEGGRAKLRYRYAPEATPSGWEPEGVMQLKLSDDGNSMSGTATSRSGAWSDRIEFRRIGPGAN